MVGRWRSFGGPHAPVVASALPPSLSSGRPTSTPLMVLSRGSQRALCKAAASQREWSCRLGDPRTLPCAGSPGAVVRPLAGGGSQIARPCGWAGEGGDPSLGGPMRLESGKIGTGASPQGSQVVGSGRRVLKPDRTTSDSTPPHSLSRQHKGTKASPLVGKHRQLRPPLRSGPRLSETKMGHHIWMWRCGEMPGCRPL